jgi:hypothetical protein
MTPFLLRNLPFLALYATGVVLSLRMKNDRREVATWGTVGFSVLLAFSILGLVEVGWVLSAHRRGVPLGELNLFLKGWGYLRMAVFHFTYAALAVGALRWREKTGDRNPQPGVWLTVSVILMIAKIILGKSVTVANPWAALVYLFSLGSVVSLLVAFCGWRGGGIPASLSEPAVDVPAPAAPSGEGAAKGMFEERDYFPFVFGVMVLGGLVCVPALWGLFTGMGYAKAIFPSLVSCGIFLYAHDKRGNFSVVKLLVGYAIVFMSLMRVMTQLGPNGVKPFFVAGGFLGFVVMFACGWAGIALGRLLRRKTR